MLVLIKISSNNWCDDAVVFHQLLTYNTGEKGGGGAECCLNPSLKHKLSFHCLVYMRP